jgi:hypothetical protein
MQNVHDVSSPLHALSNGALLWCKQVKYHVQEKEDGQNCSLGFNLYFQPIWLKLQENQVYHSKERNILV